MEEKDKVLSPIQMVHCVFDELSFRRIGFQSNASEPCDDIKINVATKEIGDNSFMVTLSLDVDRKEEFHASVRISGYCIVDRNTPNLEQLLTENIPAILLPYARAQLTVLTAQPETQPVILPVINVHELAKTAQNNPQNNT